MTYQFDVLIERDEEGYLVVSVPSLPDCHTHAKSLDALMERIREAIELCLEVEGLPAEPLDFAGVQWITQCMSKLPSITGKGLIAALTKAGLEVIRVKGSHHFLRHADGRTSVIPVHAREAIGPGLLSKILRDCDLTREQLPKLRPKPLPLGGGCRALSLRV